jgi:hypothetical protein
LGFRTRRCRRPFGGCMATPLDPAGHRDRRSVSE